MTKPSWTAIASIVIALASAILLFTEFTEPKYPFFGIAAAIYFAVLSLREEPSQRR